MCKSGFLESFLNPHPSPYNFSIRNYSGLPHSEASKTAHFLYFVENSMVPENIPPSPDCPPPSYEEALFYSAEPIGHNQDVGGFEG